MPDRSSERPEGWPEALSLVGFYTALGYIGCGIVRSLLGKSGIALSPLLAFFVLSALMLAVFRFEARLKRRPDWESLKNPWYRVAGTLLVFVVALPTILGLWWPLAVAKSLSPAASGWASFVPLAAIIYVIALNRQRRTRRERDANGQ